METAEPIELSPLPTTLVLDTMARRPGDPLLFGVALERVPLVSFRNDEHIPQLVADCVDYLKATKDALSTEVRAEQNFYHSVPKTKPVCCCNRAYSDYRARRKTCSGCTICTSEAQWRAARSPRSSATVRCTRSPICSRSACVVMMFRCMFVFVTCVRARASDKLCSFLCLLDAKLLCVRFV